MMAHTATRGSVRVETRTTPRSTLSLSRPVSSTRLGTPSVPSVAAAQPVRSTQPMASAPSHRSPRAEAESLWAALTRPQDASATDREALDRIRRESAAAHS